MERDSRLSEAREAYKTKALAISLALSKDGTLWNFNMCYYDIVNMSESEARASLFCFTTQAIELRLRMKIILIIRRAA